MLCSHIPTRLTAPVRMKMKTVVVKSPEISEAPASVELRMEGRRATVEMAKKRSGRMLIKPAAQVSKSFGVPGIKNSRKEMRSNRFLSCKNRRLTRFS